MKRTNKSGHQKRLEAKKKALEQSVACSGQKTLFDMLSRSSSISKTTLATTEQIHTQHDCTAVAKTLIGGGVFIHIFMFCSNSFF